MARVASEWCSYKRVTIAVCCVNLVAALFILRSLYTSLNLFSPADFYSPAVNYTDDQIKRVEESVRIRRAATPLEFVRVVKKLREEFSIEGGGWVLSQPMKQQLTEEILQRLNGLGDNSNVTEREAVESWRVEKLEEIKRVMLSNSTSNSTISAKEAKMLARALESDPVTLLEDLGLWMPAGVTNSEINDKPEGDEEFEDEVIPGRPLPPECHAELHADYDGAAVKWGLTHHQESAADCCQACLDHAKEAKAGEKKCNIWVYCPSEFGCYSPDIYEHKHQECWLKQADKPRLNFKGKYSESYRSSHSKAPLLVPWTSGVVAAD